MRLDMVSEHQYQGCRKTIRIWDRLFLESLRLSSLKQKPERCQNASPFVTFKISIQCSIHSKGYKRGKACWSRLMSSTIGNCSS